MTNNIIEFPGVYYGDLPADDMLRALADQKPAKVFVICWPDGPERPTYHANTSDMPVIMMRIWQFIHKALCGDFSNGFEP